MLEIISLILNLLLGTGLVIQFLTIRSIRKEAGAKADIAVAQAGKGKIELVDNTVTTMVETVNKLLEQNQKLIENYAISSEDNQRLRQEKRDLEQKFSALEKKVNRMIQTNLKVIKVLEQMGVDEEVIKPLREQE
ncbi:MAG TPA: hypothetical protein GXZ87_07655 [Bacteroidales bacterium]|nr:hypothetical protein [Bacteroidales bacterium]